MVVVVLSLLQSGVSSSDGIRDGDSRSDKSVATDNVVGFAFEWSVVSFIVMIDSCHIILILLDALR